MSSSLAITPANGIQKFAKQQILNTLAQLQHASLTLIENGEEIILGQADATLSATIEVHAPRFYTRLLSGGSIGAAESWVDQDWTSPNLTHVIRVFARSLELLAALEKPLAWLAKPINKTLHLLNQNSKAGSRTNIAAHYDLGNDMYALFLDPNMQYSSAVYPSKTASLAAAQTHKMQLICDKLALSAADHLVEIGTGWGGLACFAAKQYGCKVTTTTLSQAQHDFAIARVAEQGLSDQVTVLLKDYRDMEGQYDKLVSIEMIEAVGYRYLPSYFNKLNALLKPQGRMLIQAITIADQRYDHYRRNVDFIQRYIFPGGFLPSVNALSEQIAKQTDMTIARIESYGHHYADTLQDWYQAFSAQGNRLNELGYSDDFKRLWHFYFAYCEAGFREGTINLIQLEAEKPEARRCLNGNGNKR